MLLSKNKKKTKKKLKENPIDFHSPICVLIRPTSSSLHYIFIKRKSSKKIKIQSNQSEIFSICQRIRDLPKKLESPAENRKGGNRDLY